MPLEGITKMHNLVTIGFNEWATPALKDNYVRYSKLISSYNLC